MLAAVPIVDALDPRVDVYRGLRARESADVLWAEGPTVVQRALAAEVTVQSVFLTPAALTRLDTQLDACAATVFVAEQHVLNEVVGFNLHRGVIAVADRPHLRSVADVVNGARRLILLEGLNDPENLGAIARSARALGADGLVLDPTCADPYYRRSVRVSMGEILHLPIARAPLAEALQVLDGAGVATWALTPRRDAAAIGALALPERLALLFGAEGPGLTAAILERLPNVRIPIRADVDSLNVGHAVAAALALTQADH